MRKQKNRANKRNEKNGPAERDRLQARRRAEAGAPRHRDRVEALHVAYDAGGAVVQKVNDARQHTGGQAARAAQPAELRYATRGARPLCRLCARLRFRYDVRPQLLRDGDVQIGKRAALCELDDERVAPVIATPVPDAAVLYRDAVR